MDFGPQIDRFPAKYGVGNNYHGRYLSRQDLDHAVEQAERLLSGAKSASRSMTAAERTAAAEWLALAADAKANVEMAEQIEQMKSGSMVDWDGVPLGPSHSFAEAVRHSGWNLKSNPSVTIPGSFMLKASTFPAVTTWAPHPAGGVAALGQDDRFLWPQLPTQDAGTDTAVADFVQSARTLTGTVERAIDATTTKATVDATITASVEAIKQFAVTLDSIPNSVLESVPQITSLLNGEGQFQVNKAIDTHVLAQIVAATPAFGNTGTTTIDKVRNAIAAMRALGANPNVLVINPTDAAALDLFRVGGSTTTDGPYAFDTSREPSHPLWGLKVVERIGGGSDPMYLIDTNMLGVLYVGQVHFDADPYSEFKKNLTTLRVEVNGLFHIRNIQGARRIAAT